MEEAKKTENGSTNASDRFNRDWRRRLVIFGGSAMSTGASMMLTINELLDKDWMGAISFGVVSGIWGCITYAHGKLVLKDVNQLKRGVDADK